MILAYILSTILDVHSSCLSLKAGNREALLPFKTCKSIALSQAIIVPSVSLYSTKFLKNHTKLKKIILFSAIATHSLAAIHNYRVSGAKRR